MCSADEGADVGINGETNVSNDYKPGLPSAFTGKIIKVTVEQKWFGIMGAQRSTPRTHG